MFETLQYHWLKKKYPLEKGIEQALPPRQDLSHIFGKDFRDRVKGKTVLDFGCGHGLDTEEIAHLGAKLAIGLEIRADMVKANNERVQLRNCRFYTHLPAGVKADIVMSVDAFEHFDDPAFILRLMNECLADDGEIHISFGPTWFHPYGGHLFSVFPWAHLILSEKSLIRWRNLYFTDGATRFHEVAGGLNKMTISRFEKIVKDSPLEFIELDCRPMKNNPMLQKMLGREFATGAVKARLRKKRN